MSQPSFDKQPSRWPDQPEELWQLLGLTCDNQAQPEDVARLEAILQADKRAQELYLAYLEVHAKLQWRYRDETCPLVVPAVAANGEADTSSRFDAVPSQAPVLGFLGRATAVMGQPAVWSVLAVGVLFAGYFAAISWDMLGREAADERLGAVAGNSDSDLQPSASGLESDSVATITASEAAVWSQDSEIKPFNPRPQSGAKGSNPGSEITPGQPLSITSGLVELQLKQGATLLIEGPADWKINGENTATLTRGRLVAKVPPQAVGFTLETPTARIVDLGTEFGVEVAEQGATNVHVLAGKIDFNATASPSGGTLPTSRRLLAGQAARIEADSAQVESTPFSTQRFDRAKHVLAKSRGRLIAIDLRQRAVASQSSTFTAMPELAAQPSSAIDGDLATCSHTGRDDTAPWWQVDLGELRELAAVAIQNRQDCCAGRLRDIEILVLAEDGATVVYRTPVLNRENLDWGNTEYMKGPSQLTADFARAHGAPVQGRFVRIQRTTVPAAEVVRAEHQVLSLAEVQLFEVSRLKENANQN